MWFMCDWELVGGYPTKNAAQNGDPCRVVSVDHGSNRGGSAVSLGIFPKTPSKLPGQLSI